MAVSDYSTTAGSNTAISGISLAENVMLPSGVNNAFRQLMADIKAGVPYLSGTTYLIESTDAGATAGPDFAVYRNSATPAASDLIGRYLFQGEDSAGNTETYAAIAGRISDPTSTSEDAAILIQAEIAGTLTTYVSVGANAAGTATANAVGLPLGQLSFPATQNASSDANTLDDYEEGTATITAAFATPGNSSWAYGAQTFTYTKVGNWVNGVLTFDGTPTIGTGSGTVTWSGMPFTAGAAVAIPVRNLNSNWTWPASRTMVAGSQASGATIFTLGGLGSAVSVTAFAASNMTSGASHTFVANIAYPV